MASPIPITGQELSNLKEFHERWLSESIDTRLADKVNSLRQAQSYLNQEHDRRTETNLKTAYSYLDQLAREASWAGVPREPSQMAMGNLRQVARIIFPTPEQFGKFMELSKQFNEKGPITDLDKAFGQVAQIYISALAEDWNRASESRARGEAAAPTWAKFAQQINLPVVFGSASTPRTSALMGVSKAEPRVAGHFKWVGNIIDIAVWLERASTATAQDGTILVLSRFLGLC